MAKSSVCEPTTASCNLHSTTLGWRCPKMFGSIPCNQTLHRHSGQLVTIATTSRRVGVGVEAKVGLAVGAGVAEIMPGDYLNAHRQRDRQSGGVGDKEREQAGGSYRDP